MKSFADSFAIFFSAFFNFLSS